MRRTWPHSKQILLTQQTSDNNLFIGCAIPGTARRGRIHSSNCSCACDWQIVLRNKPAQSWFANHGCVLILVALMMPQTEGKINVSAAKVKKISERVLCTKWFNMVFYDWKSPPYLFFSSELHSFPGIKINSASLTWISMRITDQSKLQQVLSNTVP